MTPRLRPALPLTFAFVTLAGLVHADNPAAPPTTTAPVPTPTATASTPAVPQVGQNAQISATAEALFSEGRALLKDKKYSEACPKLAESLRLDPAIGTMLYLADCYEKNGQTASAWAMFNDAASAAHNANQGDRELKAKQRVDALAKKLVKLSIAPGPDNAGVADLEIKRDGVVIGSALFGTAVPVDPGDHKIEVTAPGKKTWSGVATVPSKAGSSVAFVIPRLEDLPPPPPPEPTVTATAVVPPPAPTVTAKATSAPTPTFTAPPPPTGPDNSNVRTIGLVVGGVGVAGLAVAGVLGGLAKSKNDEALAKYCDQDNCTDEKGIVLTNDAKTLAIGSTVGFVLGGVTLATGAVLILYPALAKPSSPTSGKTSTRRPSPPEIVVGPGSLTVRGRF